MTKKKATKKATKKEKCFACSIPGFIGSPHRSDCKAGAKATIKRVVALLNDLGAYMHEPCDEENCTHKECEESMHGERYENDFPEDLYDLVYNLAVLASAQAERIGVKVK